MLTSGKGSDNRNDPKSTLKKKRKSHTSVTSSESNEGLHNTNKEGGQGLISGLENLEKKSKEKRSYLFTADAQRIPGEFILGI